MTDPHTLRIYTDRSGIDGYIGAAAVAPTLDITGVSAYRTAYIGKTTTLTVYAAELRGIKLGLAIALNVYTVTNTLESCTIFIDN